MSEENEMIEAQEPPAAAGEGWRTTYSHTSNWKPASTDCGRVLASNADTLVLAINLVWKDQDFFHRLERAKQDAIARDVPVPIEIASADGSQRALMSVHQYGKDGYRWIISSPEFHIKIGEWMRPTTRPSAMVEIRSQALWLQGVIEVLDRLALLLNGVGAFIDTIKITRIDLCVDLFVSDEIWCANLFLDHSCTRATDIAIYSKHRKLSGAQIGRGKILARIYDKALEIVKSQKVWMYDIWNIHSVPDGFKVIRIEFQLRREILRELAVDTIWHFINHPQSLWNYCVHKWLKFVDDRALDGREQQLIPFWKTVQDGFIHSQNCPPMVRAKMVEVEQRRAAQHILGHLTSLIAMKCETPHPSVRLEDNLALVTSGAKLIGMNDAVLSERVRLKMSKKIKITEKFEMAQAIRNSQGLPAAKPK